MTTIIPSANAAAALSRAHAKLLNAISITEDEWLLDLFNYGYQHAQLFANLFTGKVREQVLAFLLQHPPLCNEAHNLYWMWFKYKYMIDDEVFIANYHRIPYDDWKQSFIYEPFLEEELLALLDSNNIL